MTEASRPITADEVEAFARDGAVRLEAALSPFWIGRIVEAMDEVLAAPSARAKFADPARQGFFQDIDNWRRIPQLVDIVGRSPAAHIAASLLRSRRINFLQDHILVKEPNTERPTVWHQDQPYSPIDGRDFVTLWIPVDPVPQERSLRFVRGSHLAGRWYRPRHFSSGEEREGDDPRWTPLPDVDADPLRFPQIAWAAAPGDVVAFHGLTLHGAPGNLSATERRRVLSLRWTGEDARFAPRSGPMSPAPPAETPLIAGQRIDCPAFPLVLGE